MTQRAPLVRDGDRVFAFADKFVIVLAGSMGEYHSCALHRDAAS